MKLKADKALTLWHEVLARSLHAELPDLTTRQFALLLQVYLAEPPHTVRGLAEMLNMSKPAVTRALDRLGQLGYLKRRTDAADRRSVLIQRTVKGSVFLRDFGDMASEVAKEI